MTGQYDHRPMQPCATKAVWARPSSHYQKWLRKPLPRSACPSSAFQVHRRDSSPKPPRRPRLRRSPRWLRHRYELAMAQSLARLLSKMAEDFWDHAARLLRCRQRFHRRHPVASRQAYRSSRGGATTGVAGVKLDGNPGHISAETNTIVSEGSIRIFEIRTYDEVRWTHHSCAVQPPSASART